MCVETLRGQLLHACRCPVPAGLAKLHIADYYSYYAAPHTSRIFFLLNSSTLLI